MVCSARSLSAEWATLHVYLVIQYDLIGCRQSPSLVRLSNWPKIARSEFVRFQSVAAAQDAALGLCRDYPDTLLEHQSQISEGQSNETTRSRKLVDAQWVAGGPKEPGTAATRHDVCPQDWVSDRCSSLFTADLPESDRKLRQFFGPEPGPRLIVGSCIPGQRNPTGANQVGCISVGEGGAPRRSPHTPLTPHAAHRTRRSPHATHPRLRQCVLIARADMDEVDRPRRAARSRWCGGPVRRWCGRAPGRKGRVHVVDGLRVQDSDEFAQLGQTPPPCRAANLHSWRSVGRPRPSPWAPQRASAASAARSRGPRLAGHR